ncbi:MAG TPA: HEAT repeat domain-containing protein [Tepidiformaceae bacterium]|nr:HEAT repeat domain-containing protein [Tepidiformaceae bacterium]
MTTVTETPEQATERLEGLLAKLGDEEGTVRHNARVALVIAGYVAVPGLIERLEHGNMHARWEAAKALTIVRDERAIPALVNALMDEVPGVRWLAASALATLGRGCLEGLLHGMLEHSHSAWFREGAHHVLVQVGRDDLRELVGPLLRSLEGVEPGVGVLVPTHQVLKSLHADVPVAAR